MKTFKFILSRNEVRDRSLITKGLVPKTSWLGERNYLIGQGCAIAMQSQG